MLRLNGETADKIVFCGGRNSSFHFDIEFDGEVVGTGHVFWFVDREGEETVVFRTLVCNIIERDIAEDVWMELGLEQQLPEEFREGYELSEEEMHDIMLHTF